MPRDYPVAARSTAWHIRRPPPRQAGGRAPAEALSEMDLSLRSQPGLRDPQLDVADASWPWVQRQVRVIGRCGTPVPATSANGPPSVQRARRKCRPTGRCPGRGELAGAGMTGAQRRGRDDYAPSGVEVDPHRRTQSGGLGALVRSTVPGSQRRVQTGSPGAASPRIQTRSPSVMHTRSAVQTIVTVPPPGAPRSARAPRFVSRRPDRPLPCQGRVDTGNASGSYCCTLYNRPSVGTLRRCADAASRRAGPQVVGFSGPRAPPRRVRVACLSHCLFEHPWPAVTSVLQFGVVLSPV